MNDDKGAQLSNALAGRAQKIANVKIQIRQAELAQILRDAAPDGDVEIQPDGRVTMRARRLFIRMLNNEKLRFPISFLNGVL